MSASTESSDKAMWRGIGAGLLASTVLGLGAGFVAVGFWPWPEEAGEGFAWVGSAAGMVLSGVVVGGLIGLVVGTSLAWHGGIIGSTVDRGDAAPIYGVLTGIVLGGSFGPVLGGVLGLLLGQLLGGAVFGLILGPIVGIVGWQTAYWMSDFTRGNQHSH
jgi:hypothetical protein